jgi:hypothetical protein
VLLALQAAAQNSSVLRQEHIEIPQTFGVDLDAGKVPTSPQSMASVDLWFEAVTDRERYLRPMNGATMAMLGTEPVGYSGCAAAKFSGRWIDVESLQKGTYLCVKTKQGRYSEVRVDEVSQNLTGPTPLSLMVTYTIWNTASTGSVPHDSQEHQVARQGRAEIPQTFHFDFDRGEVSQRGEAFNVGYDVWYEAVNSQLRYIVPINGAALAVMGKQAIDYAGCAAAKFSNQKVDLGSLEKGTWLCIRTNERRFSRFSVDDLYPAFAPRTDVLTLAITYTTWER